MILLTKRPVGHALSDNRERGLCRPNTKQTLNDRFQTAMHRTLGGASHAFDNSRCTVLGRGGGSVAPRLGLPRSGNGRCKSDAPVG